MSGLVSSVNTDYIYGMVSKLVNVRLDEERLRKARTLRANGVALSSLVREAIDARFEALAAPGGRDLTTVVQQIFAQYPDPPDLAPREYDVHDRHAARRAIAGKLRRVR